MCKVGDINNRIYQFGNFGIDNRVCNTSDFKIYAMTVKLSK